MKYIAAVPGVCLKELVRLWTNLSPMISQIMFHQMEQVADGLHFLSQYKIVHGDLKGVSLPRDVLLRSDSWHIGKCPH